MLLYAYDAYLVAFKYPDWQPISFEYYQPEVCLIGRYFCQQTPSQQMFV
jgi:hypothetical protein